MNTSGAEHLAVLAVNESAAIEFRCHGTLQGPKIATNNFGIREMSGEMLHTSGFRNSLKSTFGRSRFDQVESAYRRLFVRGRE